MRPEQEAAVEETATYFKSIAERTRNKPPHFLWNAKMRFGKTFTAYQLAKKMGWRKVLVLTFKPAVQNAWEEDSKCHIDFKGWHFISPGGLSYEDADKKSRSSASALCRIIWVKIQARAALRQKTNGFMRPTGIV